MGKYSILVTLFVVKLIFAVIILEENFETGDFSANSWIMSGDADWLIDNSVPYEGTSCAKSGNIDDNQVSSISFNITISEGQVAELSYNYKVSSEKTYDKLKIFINDVLVNDLTFSGEIAWSHANYTIESIGTQNVKFSYEKDGSVSSTDDCAWLDNIRIDLLTNPPVLSLESGYYQISDVLEITYPDQSATIFYTDDGSEPSNSNGSIYNVSTGILFSDYSGATTIQAVAYNGEERLSQIATGMYYISDVSGTPLGGSFSEDLNLTLTDSPYYVVDNVIIEDGTSVTIEAGVELLFIGNYSFTVLGCLIAEGSESLPINFTVAEVNEELFENNDTDDGGWGGIRFIDISASNAPSLINFCEFSYGKSGFDNNNEGGAICVEGDDTAPSKLTISNSNFLHNRTNYRGGAIKTLNAEVDIINNTILENEARWDGGGINIWGSKYNVLIESNTIENNLAGEGGGISLSSSNAVIRNNHIIGNKAKTSGNAIYNWTSGTDQFKLYNNFISGNISDPSSSSSGFLYLSAIDGGEIYNNSMVNNEGPIVLYYSTYTSFKKAIFKNNIIYNNNNGNIQFSGGLNKSELYNCIIQQGELNLGSNFSGIYENCFDVDPQLNITTGYILNDNSPCINSGNSVNDGTFPEFDIDGNSRIYDLNQNSSTEDDFIDIGAYEYQGTPTGVTFPTFSHNSGTYYNEQSIEISCNTEGAEIRYTLDGTEPNRFSYLYVDGNPIVIDCNTPIIAKAFKGELQSLTNSIEVNIIITALGTWHSIDSPIYVNTDIKVLPGDHLSIEPGVKVIFNGSYSIRVEGSISATGTAEEMIEFTRIDTTGFYNHDIEDGGWKGINIINPTANIEFNYCKFEYGKKIVETNPYYIVEYESGGAIYFSGLTEADPPTKININNCIFDYNKARDNGALHIENGEGYISNCLFVNNYSEGGLISLTNTENSSIVNCTITGNSVNTSEWFGGTIDISNSKNTFISNALLYNNKSIDTHNQYFNVTITNGSVCTISNCLIEGGEDAISDGSILLGTYTSTNLLNTDPVFSDDQTKPYSLGANSPCVENGDNSLVSTDLLSSTDISGNARLYGTNIDIGAYELQTEAQLNPVVILSSESFEFSEENPEQILEISNHGNKDMTITFHLYEGLSDDFTIIPLTGTYTQDGDNIEFTIEKFNSATLQINYTTTGFDGYDYLLFASDDINTEEGSIILKGNHYLLPDLIVEKVSETAGFEGIIGQPLYISWKVTNIAEVPTNSSYWLDKVYIFRNDILIESKSFNNLCGLGTEDTDKYYIRDSQYILDIPYDWAPADYTIQIVTNVAGARHLIESDYDNNTTVESIPLTINRSDNADLEFVGDITTSISSIAEANETYDVTWVVKNTGNGPSNSLTWYDAVYFSPDTNYDTGEDILLGKFIVEQDNFVHDSQYTVTESVTIPYTANAGIGYIYVYADVENDVYEYSTTGNGEVNFSSEVTFQINAVEAPDLVSTVTLPETEVKEFIINTGEIIDLTCIIKNDNLNENSPFEDYCKDRIYLSEQDPASTVFDPLNAYTLTTRTQSGIKTLLNVPDGTSIKPEYTFTADVVIPLNTGFNPAKDYFDSYLFSTPENTSKTLEYFGYNKVTEKESSKIIEYLKSKATNTNTSIKYQSDPDELRYIYLHADYNNYVFEGPVGEGAELNNLSNTGMITIHISDYADLDIGTVTLKNTEFKPGDFIEVTWTVENTGLATAESGWTDKIYISPESVWDIQSSKPLEEVVIKTDIPDNSSSNNFYTIKKILKVPVEYFAYPAFSESYIHIITDVYNDVYERYGDDAASNISDPVMITLSVPETDLAAESISSISSNGYAGSNIQISHTVINLSTEETTYSSYWTDEIFLYYSTVTDEVFIPLGIYNRVEKLGPEESYTAIKDYQIPYETPEGDYNLLFLTNAKNTVYEGDDGGSNNTVLSSGTVHIIQPEPSDLVVDEESINIMVNEEQTSNLTAGQPFQFTYAVKNVGTGYTNKAIWNDGFYLSKDPVLDSFDMLIGSRRRGFNVDDNGIPIVTPLTPNGQYSITVTDTLTTNAFGYYYLIVKTDIQDDVYEHNAEKNNYSLSKMVYVNYTDIVDLAVTDVVVAPEQISYNEDITVNYTISNLGQYNAVGLIRDAVYISQQEEWSSEATLIKYIDRNIELGPNTKEKMTLETNFIENQIENHLPGLEPGDYYIYVKTNITMSIREDINNTTAIANNTYRISEPFYIGVPEIPLYQRVTDTLPKEGVKYYMVNVPDTTNVSLRVQLNRSDAKAVTYNEMYIRYDAMPTLSDYDYSYDTAYQKEQEIIVPDTKTGTYYIMINNRSSVDEVQTITLDATLLGFELLEIDQLRGGNSGEITIKFEGSGFDPALKPKLIKNINEIHAKATYFINPTELYATFDLRGADYGLYDAVLVKDMSRFEYTYETRIIDGEEVEVPVDVYIVPDSLVSLFQGKFTVEISNNRAHLENKDIPENVRGNRIFESSIEVTNISNNDIVAPLYLLKAGWTDLGPILSKLPGEDEFTAGYKKFLILAEEGPAGIIRPGQRGNTTIYAQPPGANEFMRYDMVRIEDSGFQFDFEAELFWTGADKENPNWTEAIYQLDQKIGNSWDGYNRVLSNSMNKSAFNNSCIASEILNNLIGDTARNLRYASVNEQIADPSKYGHREPVDKFNAKDPENPYYDLDDPNLNLTDDQIALILKYREEIEYLKLLKLTFPEEYQEIIESHKDIVELLGYLAVVQNHSIYDFMMMFIGRGYDDGIRGIDDRFGYMVWNFDLYQRGLRDSIHEKCLDATNDVIINYLLTYNTMPYKIDLLRDYPNIFKQKPDFHLKFNYESELLNFAYEGIYTSLLPFGQMPICFGNIDHFDEAHFIIENVKSDDLTEEECRNHPNASHKITFDLNIYYSMMDTFNFAEKHLFMGLELALGTLWVLQELGEAKEFPTNLRISEVQPMVYYVPKQ